ncbi:MAG: FAD-binding protein, partial [Cyanobacteria bacterium P01_A01_bin.83]
LFDMYQRITGENPYQVPMRIYPAVHYIMGGLWVDYNLMSTIPGLHVLGEANFSDHGANRLGASALMQGLSDGYFVIPYTLGNYLATTDLPPVDINNSAFEEAEATVNTKVNKLLNIQGNKTVTEFHRQLGKILWDKVGMSRDQAGLERAIAEIQSLRGEFWQNVTIAGDKHTFNKNLEFAGRVADFLELGELMARDALDRQESCGAHFREECQTTDGEAQRNDHDYAYVAAWGYQGDEQTPALHQEQLKFDNVKLTQRSYK